MMRNKSHYPPCAIFLTLFLTLGTPVMAACAPQPSTLDHALGAVELGANATELPNDRDTRVTEQCIGVGDVTRDCTFLRHGITYEDYGKGVDYKSLDVHAWNTDELPFGLSKFDKANEVLRKTAPFLKRKPAIEKEDGKVATFSSGLCYVNSRGKTFAIAFHFTNTEQLNSIVTYTEDFHSTAE